MAAHEETRTLEQGEIYFFYRPKMEEEAPEGTEDVQRLYLVLKPAHKREYRLAVIGRKRLPEPGEKRGRNWGFIDRVFDDAAAVREELEGGSYETKTRGKRHVQTARPLGEGVYRLVSHDDHTHLVYALELPKQPGEAQAELNVEEEASYIISVKNPEVGAPRLRGRKVKYPKQLMERFDGRRFANADPPELLAHEGAEFVLIGASDDVEQELGIKLQPERESATSADLFKDLRIDRSKWPVEPLLKGEWQ